MADQFRFGSGGHRSEAEGSGDEGAGFGPMNFDEFLEGDAFFFRVQVEDLAGDEAEAAGGVGEFFHEIGGGVAAVGFGPGHGGEGLGQKSIAGKHGHGFAENAVVGGAPAAEVVVIHAGKVVMDEGVGVDAFDGTGGRKGEGFRASGGSCGGQAEDGAKAFAAGEEAVPHGLMDEGGMGFGRNETIEGLFDHGKAGFPVSLCVHRDDMTNFGAEWQAGRIRSNRGWALFPGPHHPTFL